MSPIDERPIRPDGPLEPRHPKPEPLRLRGESHPLPLREPVVHLEVSLSGSENLAPPPQVPPT
jgi:hypothetical protein